MEGANIRRTVRYCFCGRCDINGLGWGTSLHIVEEMMFWVANKYHEVAQKFIYCSYKPILRLCLLPR